MKMAIEASSATEPVIVMTRIFDAPRDVVWLAFTDPKHVVRWYGGRGFSSPRCEMDVRPGGLWRHTMRTPDGSEHPLEFIYVEVVKPEKLVWQNVDHGKRTSGPPTCCNTITLEEHGKQTKWKLVARFNTIADRDLAARSGFTNIITQGSERLEAVAQELSRGAATSS
ncbi:Putative glutathione S-transferase-related transmembrane protein [Minicystis rosea]|nr:Putative glutathione S-transferase-related transmembrane protein [Minicystis rosea]